MTEQTMIKKGDKITITKNVYYVEQHEGGLTTDPPEHVIYLEKGTVMTAEHDGEFQDMVWEGEGMWTGLWLDWVN